MISTQVLRECNLFQGMEETHLKKVAEICREEAFSAGSTIIAEGGEANAFHIILEGEVAVDVEIPFGPHQPPQKITIQVLRQGEIFGWSTLIESPYYMESVRCVKDSKFLTLKRSDLRKLMDENLALGYTVMKGVANIIASRLKHIRSRLAVEWGLCTLYDQGVPY